MCPLDSAIGATSVVHHELATMRRNVQRRWSVVGWDGATIRRNIGQSGMSPNRTNKHCIPPILGHPVLSSLARLVYFKLNYLDSTDIWYIGVNWILMRVLPQRFTVYTGYAYLWVHWAVSTIGQYSWLIYGAIACHSVAIGSINFNNMALWADNLTSSVAVDSGFCMHQACPYKIFWNGSSSKYVWILFQFIICTSKVT